MEKNRLRRLAKEKRDRMDPACRQEAALRILERLTGQADYPEVSRIFLFSSIGSEPETEAWAERFRQDGKKTFYPRTEKHGRMEFYHVKEKTDLEPGAYGIREPKANCEWGRPEEGDWILTPGLAFDARGFRIGYGGGYYDRYAERFPEGIYIGVAFEIQRIEGNIEADRFDRPLQRLATEKMVCYF